MNVHQLTDLKLSHNDFVQNVTEVHEAIQRLKTKYFRVNRIHAEMPNFCIVISVTENLDGLNTSLIDLSNDGAEVRELHEVPPDILVAYGSARSRLNQWQANRTLAFPFDYDDDAVSEFRFVVYSANDA